MNREELLAELIYLKGKGVEVILATTKEVVAFTHHIHDTHNNRTPVSVSINPFDSSTWEESINSAKKELEDWLLIEEHRKNSPDIYEYLTYNL